MSLLLNLYSLTGNDKYIEHPVLGGLSCEGTYKAYRKCYDLLGKDSSGIPVHCRALYDISKKE